MNHSVTVFYRFLSQRFSATAHAVLGSHCYGCGLATVSPLCEACQHSIVRTVSVCDVCAKAITSSASTRRCVTCIRNPPAFAHAEFVADYDGLCRDMIVAAKVGFKPSALHALRYLLNEYLMTSDFRPPVGALLVPMPIPRLRLGGRGFNLPRLFTQQLSQHWGVPIMPSAAITLPFYTRKQALLSRRERLRHRPAYKVATQMPERVVLIDDVITTGQSVGWLSESLRRRGCKDVIVWSYSRSQ